MDQQECITKSPHRKGAHLTFEERVIIQTRLRDGRSPPQIAKEIGCAPNTVRNEIRRGKVLLYNGKHEGYRAVNGQDIYYTKQIVKTAGAHRCIRKGRRFSPMW